MWKLRACTCVLGSLWPFWLSTTGRRSHHGQLTLGTVSGCMSDFGNMMYISKSTGDSVGPLSRMWKEHWYLWVNAGSGAFLDLFPSPIYSFSHSWWCLANYLWYHFGSISLFGFLFVFTLLWCLGLNFFFFFPTWLRLDIFDFIIIYVSN